MEKRLVTFVKPETFDDLLSCADQYNLGIEEGKTEEGETVFNFTECDLEQKFISMSISGDPQDLDDFCECMGSKSGTNLN